MSSPLASGSHADSDQAEGSQVSSGSVASPVDPVDVDDDMLDVEHERDTRLQEQEQDHSEISQTRERPGTSIGRQIKLKKAKDEKKPKTKAAIPAAQHIFDANGNKNLLSTSSPEGIAAASQVTPNKIASLLLEHGPLPIRHITSHLASQIHGFGNLSLSKQRRLIMASLETGDPVTMCVFEKIGWGQWEARKTTIEEINSRIATSLQNSGNANNSHKNNRSESDSPPDDYNDFSSSIPKTLTIENPIRRKSEMQHKPRSISPRSSGVYRRESITNSSNDLHATKVPLSPSLQPLQNLRRSYKERQLSLDEAIDSSSEDELDLNSSAIDDEDDEVFSFDSEDGHPPKKFGRSLSNSFISHPQRRSLSGAGITKPKKARSSFSSSYALDVALDETGLDSSSIPEGVGINSKRRPRVSFSNSSSVTRQSFLRTNLSPSTHPLTVHDSISSISVNKADPTDTPIKQENGSNKTISNSKVSTNGDHYDTDEEDWESMGVNGFKRSMSQSAYVVTPSTPSSVEHGQAHGAPVAMNLIKPEPNQNENIDPSQDEKLAALALMGLKSV